MADPQISDSQPFGTRYLTDQSLVFEQNAWDHAPPPDDQSERIQAAIERQQKSPVPSDKKAKYNARPSLYWDIFYRNNSSNFFKDRKWLHREFPQLEDATRAKTGPKTILEVGCGAGNVVFPLLSLNENPSLRLCACDFSKNAIKVVKSHALYDSPPVGTVHASVWDLSSQTLPGGLTPGSVDIIVMIFVLSALHPSEWAQAIANVYTLLKPGGQVLLRDYGRHDLTQLRFKERRMLDDNFYIRGDGTRVYFFQLEELSKLFTGSEVHVQDDSPIIRTMKTVRIGGDASGAVTPLTETPLGGDDFSEEEIDDLEGGADGAAPNADENVPTEGSDPLVTQATPSTAIPAEPSQVHSAEQPFGTITLVPATSQDDSLAGPVTPLDFHDAPLSPPARSSITLEQPSIDLEELFPFTDELDDMPGRTAQPRPAPRPSPAALKPTKASLKAHVLAQTSTHLAQHAPEDLLSQESASIPPVPPIASPPAADLPPHPLFTINQLGIDRRLLVNRKRQLKMYRVWMQGEFKKQSEPSVV